MGILSGWTTSRSLFRDPSWRDARPLVTASDDWESSMEPMNWEDICRHEDFRGRWVALDECRYDEDSGRAMAGAVVDVDDDLVELCNRIRESERRNCAILFCGEDGAQEPPTANGDGDEDPFQHTAH